MDQPESTTAAIYREQADAFRRLADTEPLQEKRKLLLISAARYDEMAARREAIDRRDRTAARMRDAAVEALDTRS